MAVEWIAGDAHLVQLVDAAFADAAERSGPHLVCRAGCCQCCHGAFAIGALDAWRLREGMERLRMENPRLAEVVEQRGKAYLAEHGAAFPGDLASGTLGTTDEEQEAFEEYANEAACPALDPATGLCDLYAARPMTCRVFGPPVRAADAEDGSGLAVCELCFTEATQEEVAACEMAVPHAEEARVEALLPEAEREAQTIVAFCLIGDK
jgi:Fe-S-cluster containining protein